MLMPILFNGYSANESLQMTAPFIPNTLEWHQGPDLEENWQDRYSEQEDDEE
jgi:hypothetical protein